MKPRTRKALTIVQLCVELALILWPLIDERILLPMIEERKSKP